MKKFLSMALALAMAAALAVPAMATWTETASTATSVSVKAEESESTAYTKDIPITANITSSSAGDTVTHAFYVDISWEVTNVTGTVKSAGTNYVWNGTAYTNGGSAGNGSDSYNDGAIKVTITNRSDLDVKANVKYTANSNASTFAALDGTEKTIATIVPSTGDARFSTTYTGFKFEEFTGTIALNGYQPANNATVGTVKVTVSKAA